jgi:hypothetical protein
VVSVGLVGIAVLLAVVIGFEGAPALGVAYLMGCAVAPLAIVYAFCAKCPCQDHCAHVVFGKLAGALTKRRKGVYTSVELAVVLLALLFLVGMPHVWLWQYPRLLAAFWGLNLIAVAQIRSFVCPACDHAGCPLVGDGRSARAKSTN